MIKKEDAEEWLKENVSHIKLLEWKHDGNKSRFIDVNRGVEFECRFFRLKAKLKETPDKLFGASKEEVQEKRKRTNIEKFGVEFPAQNKVVQEKMKQTSVERFNSENPSQNKAVQEKRKQTNIERYGVENPSQNKNIQEKIIQTNIEKYGVRCALQNREVQEKRKQTNIERFGAENPFQNKEIKDKIKQTMIENGNMIVINGKTLQEIASEKQCSYTALQQLHKKFGPSAVVEYEKKQVHNTEACNRVNK